MVFSPPPPPPPDNTGILDFRFVGPIVISTTPLSFRPKGEKSSRAAKNHALFNLENRLRTIRAIMSIIEKELHMMIRFYKSPHLTPEEVGDL
uniref:Uncharacterized protein n=1 Tax=Candidatus Kentrum sp. SD TaxID=2126332 RepID=A0A450YGZ9_9GAMM|nr:MAG: hypothetical protein BECKSD772F_GA0070984_10698 [Candidatus Kentron sp. SD]